MEGVELSFAHARWCQVAAQGFVRVEHGFGRNGYFCAGFVVGDVYLFSDWSGLHLGCAVTHEIKVDVVI